MNGKIEKVFLIAMMVFGIVAGIAIVVILMAIAVPAMSPYLLTLAEKADFEHMAKYAALFIESGMTALLLPALAIGICTALLFLAVLNRQCMNGIRNWRSRAGMKLATAAGAMIGWIFVLAATTEGTSGSGTVQTVVHAMIIVGATALLWLIAGETGWAGDFSSSSWSCPPLSDVRRSLQRGAAAGVAAFTLIRLVEWTQGKYFILVSEVLDRSGETSFLGYQLLAAGIIVMLGTAFLLFGWFVVALAPVPRVGMDIKQRLKGPAALSAILVIVLLVGYGYAGRSYDLDKKDLASVLSIPAAASGSGTIVILQPDKERPLTIQEGIRAVSGSGFLASRARSDSQKRT